MPRFADPQADVSVGGVRRHRSKELFQTLEGIRVKTFKQGIHRKPLLSPMLVASSGVFCSGLNLKFWEIEDLSDYRQETNDAFLTNTRHLHGVE